MQDKDIVIEVVSRGGRAEVGYRDGKVDGTTVVQSELLVNRLRETKS